MCNGSVKKFSLVWLSVLVLVLGVPLAYASTQVEKLRDPTQPLNYRAATKAASALKLQAIFLGGSQPKAIINGKTLVVGDVFDGKKILTIKENEVVYRSGSQTRTLKLRSSIYKK